MQSFPQKVFPTNSHLKKCFYLPLQIFQLPPRTKFPIKNFSDIFLDLSVEQLHNAPWREILPPTKLGSSSQHFVAAQLVRKCSHIRFNIYPDGGVARLRVYGDPTADWSLHKTVNMGTAQN
jgi:allantoicase